MKNKNLLIFAAGVVVGGLLGVLFAPKKGQELRNDIKKTFDDLADRGKDFYEKKTKKSDEIN